MTWALRMVICASMRSENGHRLNVYRRILAFSLGLVAVVGNVEAQIEPVEGLSRAEARMLGALIERFQPLPSVERIWTGAFTSAAKKSEDLKAAIDSVERSGLPEDQVLVQVGAMGKELRVVKSDRNAFIGGFLSPWEQLALDSILSPPAPSIQHFGFHDRLKCLVCKKPGEGAIFPSGVSRPDQLLLPKD
jgi:hypothetical protein